MKKIVLTIGLMLIVLGVFAQSYATQPTATPPSSTMYSTSSYSMGSTNIPASNVSEPFAASPRHAISGRHNELPGGGGISGGTGGQPGLNTPIGDEMVPMLVMAVLCAGVVLLRRKLKIEK